MLKHRTRKIALSEVYSCRTMTTNTQLRLNSLFYRRRTSNNNKIRHVQKDYTVLCLIRVQKKNKINKALLSAEARVYK